MRFVPWRGAYRTFHDEVTRFFPRVRQRRSGTRWEARLLAVVLAVSLVAGCQGHSSDLPGQVEPDAVVLDDLCAGHNAREGCDQIELDGVRWRYLLLPARTQTADTVILDLGGPGSAVLSGAANLSEFYVQYPGITDSHNVLVVEEPWVTRNPTGECRQALSEYYLGVRGAAGLDDVAAWAEDLRMRCELDSGRGGWGFTPASYKRLITGIAQERSLRLVAYVGHSWGAVRLSYLEGVLLDWVALVRPYPVGLSIDEILAAQTKLIDQQRLSMLTASPAQVDDIGRARSIPVTMFDRYSAEIRLGYVDDVARQASGQGVVQGVLPGRIGLLSDELWGRSGYAEISPRMLAFVEEACAVTGRPKQSAHDGVGLVLSLQFAACRGDSSVVVGPRSGARTCVVLGTGDSVAPESLGRQAFMTVPGIAFETSSFSRHTALDGLDRCLARLI